MVETDAEFMDRMSRAIPYNAHLLKAVDLSRLFALARRGAAAGELVEALKVLTANVEHAWPSLSHLGPLVSARAAIAKFEAAQEGEKKDE